MKKKVSRGQLSCFSRGAQKRGISAVIATVLIILIVVVGIGIVWRVILPLFSGLEYLSYSEVRMNIVRQGFTIYDPDAHFAFVQVERGKDNVNVTGLEIGFSFNGTTKTYQTMRFPEPGGKYTYKFNFTNDSIPDVPSKVTVAPIFIFNNKLKLGKILDSEDMPSGKLHLSEPEWEKANEEIISTIVTHPGSGETPGVIVEPIPEIKTVLVVCDINGNVGYDNGTLIEVCEFGCTEGVCDPCVSIPEICDNLIDDDCDLEVDELCSCPLYPDCPGDVNGDNVVNMSDNSIISSNWLRSDCGVSNLCCNGADLNANGFVNFIDYSIFSNNNGHICN